MIENIEQARDSMDPVIDDTHESVAAATRRIERGVESAVGRFVEGARAAVEQVRHRADATSRTAHRGLDRAAEAVDRGYTRARDSGSRATATATDLVSDNPGKALLVAASAGFALGVLTQRRRALFAQHTTMPSTEPRAPEPDGRRSDEARPSARETGGL